MYFNAPYCLFYCTGEFQLPSVERFSKLNKEVNKLRKRNVFFRSVYNLSRCANCKCIVSGANSETFQEELGFF